MRIWFIHAIRSLVLVTACVTFVGCSTVQPQVDPNAPPPLRTFEREADREYLLDAYDPMEGLNRKTYNFNYHWDKYIFLPLVRTYRFILPDYAEDRVSDFYDNLGEFQNSYNNLLQLKFKETGITLGRFGINTTVGVLGFWDRATGWGLDEKKEDLGQTFGHWGAGKGAYVVLPIGGPSNVRDGIGLGGDVLMISQVGPAAWVDNSAIYWTMAGVSPLDKRKREEFRYRETGSPFEYELVRMAYGLKRDMDVER